MPKKERTIRIQLERALKHLAAAREDIGQVEDAVGNLLYLLEKPEEN